MLAHNYHPETGRYLGATPADPDPERPGAFLFPAFSTDLAPPPAGADRVAVFVAGSWRVEALPPPPSRAPYNIAEQAHRLASSDWVALRALERGEPVPAAWVTYRQAVRDADKQTGWPEAVQWPEPPQ